MASCDTIVQLDVSQVHAVLADIEASSSAPVFLASAISQLRVLSAADGAPDEGMRGFVDRSRDTMLDEYLRPRILGAAAGALNSECPDAALHAAALIRNLSITPAAAQLVAESPVAAALAKRLRHGGPLAALAKPLAAVARLSQHHETHADLRSAGFPEALPKVFGKQSKEECSGDTRWFPEMVALVRAFFLDTRPAGCKKEEEFQPAMIDGLLKMLAVRLTCRTPVEVVSTFGAYYRPRFIVQGLANLSRVSGSRRLLGAAGSEAIPLLLRILSEPCGEDREQNAPWGSPDARQMSLQALASLAEDHDVATQILALRGDVVIQRVAAADPVLRVEAEAALMSLGLDAAAWPSSRL